MLAAAGIPLYIHLPRFATVNLGISLSMIGIVLLAIRLIDLVQDPLLGWAIDRWPSAQLGFAMLAAGGLAVGFPLLFNLDAGADPWRQLLPVLILLFTAYSLGSILLYGRSATLAASPSSADLLTLASFREAGMLVGVVVAASAPALFVVMGAAAQGYPVFGLFLGGLALAVGLVTIPIWRRVPIRGDAFSFAGLKSAGGTRLLLVALVNSLPVAVTSTLFLFFVEDRLMLKGLAGPLLVLFFVSAGLSVPIWTKLSQRIGARRTLLISMPLAIVSFIGAALLPTGASLGFSVVSAASGVALGADLVLLPAMFSVALTRAGLNASAAFGIWSFAGKLGLALAAAAVLPLVESAGFRPGVSNSPGALNALNTYYAILPCGLKLLAFALVWSLPSVERAT
jgi:Na+/melibiose symporter-like transporter